MARTNATDAALSPVPSPAGGRGERAETLNVAYHAGPPAIAFFGMDWTRGWAQEVTPMQWQGMQLRGDFKEFDFRVVGAAAAALSPGPSPASGRGEDVSKGD